MSPAPTPPSVDGPIPGGDPATGNAGMTRSEERLHIDTVCEPYARARLRVYEQTEQVMVPVTITRQWARIEYLDLRDTTAAAADPTRVADRESPPTPVGPAGGAATPWVTLFVDHPVVTLERRPVERMRLATSWVAGEQTIEELLAREEVVIQTTAQSE